MHFSIFKLKCLNTTVHTQRDLTCDVMTLKRDSIPGLAVDSFRRIYYLWCRVARLLLLNVKEKVAAWLCETRIPLRQQT